jgi:hypothetical protein
MTVTTHESPGAMWRGRREERHVPSFECQKSFERFLKDYHQRRRQQLCRLVGRIRKYVCRGRLKIMLGAVSFAFLSRIRGFGSDIDGWSFTIIFRLASPRLKLMMLVISCLLFFSNPVVWDYY